MFGYMMPTTYVNMSPLFLVMENLQNHLLFNFLLFILHFDYISLVQKRLILVLLIGFYVIIMQTILWKL